MRRLPLLIVPLLGATFATAAPTPATAAPCPAEVLAQSTDFIADETYPVCDTRLPSGGFFDGGNFEAQASREGQQPGQATAPTGEQPGGGGHTAPHTTPPAAEQPPEPPKKDADKKPERKPYWEDPKQYCEDLTAVWGGTCTLGTVSCLGLGPTPAAAVCAIAITTLCDISKPKYQRFCESGGFWPQS